mmetsp:Transcript_41984/g.106785  ORF Transcript_41984/g.106785 Transcript_41984/m.106785 type:complete len:90 (-) Transcript_41984:551-820(-)
MHDLSDRAQCSTTAAHTVGLATVDIDMGIRTRSMDGLVQSLSMVTQEELDAIRSADSFGGGSEPEDPDGTSCTWRIASRSADACLDLCE